MLMLNKSDMIGDTANQTLEETLKSRVKETTDAIKAAVSVGKSNACVYFPIPDEYVEHLQTLGYRVNIGSTLSTVNWG